MTSITTQDSQVSITWVVAVYCEVVYNKRVKLSLYPGYMSITRVAIEDIPHNLIFG